VVVFDRIRERFETNAARRPTWCSTSRSSDAVTHHHDQGGHLHRGGGAAVPGGPVLKGFSAALLIGIIAGTTLQSTSPAPSRSTSGWTAEHVFPTVKKAAFDHLP